MLTDGDTITVGSVVYTWVAADKNWVTPPPSSSALDDVSYQQELVTPAVRPLPTAAPEPPEEDDIQTRSYAYVKPDQGTPSEGQIVHQNWIQDELRIHKVGQGGQDNTALLASLVPGDEIVLLATVWTVGNVTLFDPYYSVGITPSQQSGTSGVQDFIFRRPEG